MKTIIAEKPSLALDIAKALWCDITTKSKGYYHNKDEDLYVTWVFWHLLELLPPDKLNKDWGGNWSVSKLPMIPTFDFKSEYGIKEGMSQQYNLISKLVANADEIYNAWDPDREGELLIQEILQVMKKKDNVKLYRLWLLDLNKKNIQKEYKLKRENSDYKDLFYSAFARQKADWLVGLNLTQLYTLKAKAEGKGNSGVWSTGRVQSAIVNILYERQKEIEEFQSIPYWNIKSFYSINNDKKALDWLFFKLVDKKSVSSDNEEENENDEDFNEEKKVIETRIFNKEEKDSIYTKVKDAKEGRVIDKKTVLKQEEYKGLYSKTQLMSDCSSLLWIDGSLSSNIIDELYEKYKILSYPRTDNNYLNDSDFQNFLQVVPELSEIDKYSDIIEELEEENRLQPNKKFVDNSKVTAHTWLYPLMPDNGFSYVYENLPEIHKAVLDLVIKSVLANMAKPYSYEASVIVIDINGETFKSNGNILKDKGYRILYEEYGVKTKNKVLPKLEVGDTIQLDSIEVIDKETTPPPRYNESSLLTYIEDLGAIVNKRSDNEELKKRIKDIWGDGERKLGIWTPWTRWTIIDICIKRWYIEKKWKDKKQYYYVTDKGVELIKMIDKDFFNPITTALWEDKLRQISDGELSDKTFLEDIISTIKYIIEREKEALVAHEKSKPVLLESNVWNCPKCWHPIAIKQIFSKKTGKYYKLQECTNHTVSKQGDKWIKNGCDWSEFVK